MKNRFRIICVLLAVLGGATDAVAADPTFKWTMNGVKDELVIPEERLLKCPKADPEKGILPLNFERAEILATSSVADLPKPGVLEVSLQPVLLKGEKIWIYLVTIFGGGENHRSVHVAVLMDGMVLRAAREQPK